jgi:integrase
VLTSSEGRPWGSGFGSSWNRTVRRTGLDRHFHDFRGTFATKVYLTGLSVREIAEILGWSEDRVEAILKRYVKRDEVLKDLIARMSRNAPGTETVKPAVKPPT